MYVTDSKGCGGAFAIPPGEIASLCPQWQRWRIARLRENGGEMATAPRGLAMTKEQKAVRSPRRPTGVGLLVMTKGRAVRSPRPIAGAMGLAMTIKISASLL